MRLSRLLRNGLRCWRLSRVTRRRKTPQEKKILSYAKDCRNTYGNNDKAARKRIPRRKQQQRQNERRVLKANLKKSVEDVEDLTLERPKIGMWRKLPDEPLASRMKWRNNIPVIGRNRDMSRALGKEAESRMKQSKRWKR